MGINNNTKPFSTKYMPTILRHSIRDHLLLVAFVCRAAVVGTSYANPASNGMLSKYLRAATEDTIISIHDTVWYCNFPHAISAYRKSDSALIELNYISFFTSCNMEMASHVLGMPYVRSTHSNETKSNNAIKHDRNETKKEEQKSESLRLIATRE